MPIVFAIDVAGGGEELRGVDLVLQIAAAEVLVIHVLEGHAVAGRAADVRRDDGVAARDERDHVAAETCRRLAGRTAVRQDDAGILPLRSRLNGTQSNALIVAPSKLL